MGTRLPAGTCFRIFGEGWAGFLLAPSVFPFKLLRLYRPYYSNNGAAPSSQNLSRNYPFSTRSLISEYAASTSFLSAASFAAVPGLSFTWRMDLPAPSSNPAGSASAAP